jgi:membrane protein DedA with SNARE-associated domain
MAGVTAAAEARRGSALKLALLAFGLASVLAAAYLVAEAYGWTDERRFADLIDAAAHSPGGRWRVGVAVAGLLVADLALPVPSSLVMTLAGRFLGTPWAFASNVVGSLGGAALGYALCRRFGRPAFARLFGEDTAPAEALFAALGPWAIALSRPVPMLTEVVSCLAGLTRMGFPRFLAFSLLGTAPISLAYAWLGAAARQGVGVRWPLLLAIVLPGFGMLAVWLLGHLRPRAAAAAD